MEKILNVGIDVGSTTVKIVILDINKNILYSNYIRHFSRVKETVLSELKKIKEQFNDFKCKVSITGSAGLGLSNKSNIGFVQEVHSSFIAVKEYYPSTDVVVELGGEDAKIIFLTNGVEERMNGSCAGGTGAFIDQMATLLGVSVNELDSLASKAQKVYPIASRCGVFAKSDIQPLINQGANKEDIAASIFQAVVDQTVAGLAQGRKIKGTVLFLGGPLSFIKSLQNAFIKTLKLDNNHAIFPANGPIFIALGAALYSKNEKITSLNEIINKIENISMSGNIITTEPLFNNEEEYNEFKNRHYLQNAKYADIKTYKGNAYLGIDAGSTTTKLVLLSDKYEILYSHYVSNKGKPLDIVVEQLKEIYSLANKELKIVSSAVTGYGEELIKAGLGVENGIVETIAHYKAASYFCPNVDFIIDIGGQDIKCFKIKNKAIDSIILNEACSSGCGSFIQAFAEALGYSIKDFAKLGLFSKHPVDLGSRCTVFMNSSVKQAQKDGASVEDISAGLSQSIIKNAIYKVIRIKDTNELGQNIVAQGGTFLNDAVLRSFERELHHNVIRPEISELMGAFGAAIYASEHIKESTLIDYDSLNNFSYKSVNSICNMCTAHCNLNIINFNGGRHYISGNRCDKVTINSSNINGDSLYDYKLKLLSTYSKLTNNKKIAKVGLPLGLNFYEQLPLFATIFNELGFEVVVSDISTRNTYFNGQHTIASDTVCYPAKLIHGHIINLLNKKVDFIFYPCETYNLDEGESDNHYNCPVVAYYPETLKANNEDLNNKNFISPYIDLNNKKQVIHEIYESLKPYHISKKDINIAVEKGYQELNNYHLKIKETGQHYLNNAIKNNQNIIVLAGRVYHIDPEINHGIARYISSLGICVLSEDFISMLDHTPSLGILNQWTYHSRLYKAANYVIKHKNMQMIQLVSFGCGIDAITTDELRSFLESHDKLYTQLKIDEINNLGALKIRIRSLLAAMDEKKEKENVSKIY